MSLGRLWSRFVFGAGNEPRVIDGAGLPIDYDLALRNDERAAELRRQLGSRWICAQPVARRTAAPMDRGR